MAAAHGGRNRRSGVSDGYELTDRRGNPPEMEKAGKHCECHRPLVNPPSRLVNDVNNTPKPGEGADFAPTPPRPIPLSVIAENIPATLRDLGQWLLWRYEWRQKRWTKVPFNAKTNQFGKSNDPATWCDFEAVLRVYQTGHYDGIGFAFTAGDGLCGVDLDHVLNPDTGEIEGWALEVLERFQGAYIERSPSGTGLRIFCRGKPTRCGKGTDEKRIEVYDHTSPRYLTVTGHRYG